MIYDRVERKTPPNSVVLGQRIYIDREFVDRRVQRHLNELAVNGYENHILNLLYVTKNGGLMYQDYLFGGKVFFDKNGRFIPVREKESEE